MFSAVATPLALSCQFLWLLPSFPPRPGFLLKPQLTSYRAAWPSSLASPELGILPHWWFFDFLGKAYMPQPSSQESMAPSSPSSAPALLWTIQLPGLKTCEPHSLQSFGATEHTRLHLCYQPVPRTPRQWAESLFLCGKRRQSRQHSCWSCPSVVGQQCLRGSSQPRLSCSLH